ncbi:MAG: GTPase HflX [Porticoccaceae bacterium]|nr:GTPase HflX [Porticoccaceae bacterium]|tara:strand:+ start:51515 stop:52813 length:1299 start_codon:yes stop_codon:yes gene_type:complete
MPLFFGRPISGKRVVMVSLRMQAEGWEENVKEFEELVASSGGYAVGLVTGSKKAPEARFFLSLGKLDEVALLRLEKSADLIILNHNLSASQERNLEEHLKCKVLDRNGLILEIFAQRARTHEGKLQVELAQLKHLSTRLIRGWTHLERQKGGIGLRGPGETQLESDRRLVRARIASVRNKLLKIRQQRSLGRQSRCKSNALTISLVGYTNVGKSTIFNNLTKSGVYAADKLFATLDPTMRRGKVKGIRNTVFSDTVGFIRQLPHSLIEAFQGTLEEICGAALLLHVLDASAADVELMKDSVDSVLEEIGADNIRALIVYNKVDLLDHCPCRIDRDGDGNPVAVWVSAETGDGMDLLANAISECVEYDSLIGKLSLPPALASLRAELYNCGAVTKESIDNQGVSLVDVKMNSIEYARVSKRFKEFADIFTVAS